MFCQYCGQPLLPGYAFCTRCGRKLIQPGPMPNPAEDLTAAETTPELTACDPSAAVTEETPVAEETTPRDLHVLPGSDPAAISDESGTYMPPAQPYAPIPYPQYGYPGAAPQYPPYPYCGAPMPQYPQMSASPYGPYAPYPVYPQYPNVPPMTPPVVKDVPPAKVGRRRVPVIIMAVLLLAGLLLFFFGPDMTVSTTQGDAAQTQSATPWFHIEDGTLYFDPDLYTGPEELTIPETVDGQTVICIADDCFAGNSTITTVILPEGLEEIGSGAFANCTAIRGIFIPEGVKLIGSGAFEGCTGLEAIYVPSSVAIIGRNAFRGCSDLKHIMFDGTYMQWYGLYSSYISSETQVYCSDGTVPQGGKIP